MNKKVADRAFALLLLLFVFGFMAMAMQLNTTARRMPIMVAVFTLVCIAAYFVAEFWPRGAAVPVKAKPKPPTECEPGEVKKPDALNWYDVRVWGWLVVLFACVFLAGIIPGIGLLTVFFYHYGAKGSWKGSIVFAVLQMVFLYVIFELAFREEMYRGIIWELLVH